MIECRSIYGNTILIPREKLKFRPSVYALVVHENKVLLLKSRSTDLLALPGGGIELGETMADGLKRELREETGIEVEVEVDDACTEPGRSSRFLRFDESFFYYDPSGNAYHAFRFLYACQPLNFDLVADEDVEDGENEKPRWYDIGNLTAEQFLFSGNFVMDYLKQQ